MTIRKRHLGSSKERTLGLPGPVAAVGTKRHTGALLMRRAPTHDQPEITMEIEGSVALVTGANRGLGASFCRQLLERGAAKVYAGARDPGSVIQPGVVPIQLDVTSPDDIAAAAAQCDDLTLLVNNAGIGTGTPALSDGALEAARREFETNVFGPLALTGAFAPVLAANGGGAVVNVLSVLSWLSVPSSAVYCASKAAGWSFTNSLRQELLGQNTQVVGLYVGFMDTDMTAGLDVAKSDPDAVAGLTLDGVAAGAHEVLADDTSRFVRDALSGELAGLYPVLGQ
jgi:NAD(P)-dependent dehydrogenase (short-subunit alcohol dehydrogenase family)